VHIFLLVRGALGKSTLKAAFEGRKDLFTDLWLENKHNFKPHPIVRLDFSNVNFRSKNLDEGIVDWLRINALEKTVVKIGFLFNLEQKSVTDWASQ
jgi:hypothetical protein